MTKNILLVDDEKTIIDISKKYLEKEGYVVFEATNGKEAFTIFEANNIDLIITDIMMPEKDGYDLIIDILEENADLPFIFITAKNANQDRLYALTLGADDYITKPYNPRELVLRVKNILRRVYRQSDSQIQIAALTMDYERRSVKIGQYALDLTTKEFALLWLLAKDTDKVFSKSEILSCVWQSYSIDDQNTVNVHIHRLREKLHAFANIIGAPMIKTIWGTGYKLEVIE